MAYEYELTNKKRFYLYLNTHLPNLDIIERLYKQWRKDEYQEILDYHESVSPFRPHPCGDSSVFGKICGIDPDMFDLYISPRQRYLSAVTIIGHPYFLCKVDKDKSYYDTFNIGTGKGTSVLELIKCFENVTENKLNFKIGDRRKGDVAECFADVSKANKFLNWKSELSVEDSLLSSWNWEKNINNEKL